MPRITAQPLPPGKPNEWPMEYSCSVGRWIDEGRDIEVICTRCCRIAKLSPEYLAEHAKSRSEGQNFFCIRLRCKVCGGSGSENGFARMKLWGRHNG